MPYESPWSVLTNFRAANSLSCDEMYRLYGNTQVRNLKQKIGLSHKSIYRLNGFDLPLLEKELNLPIGNKNQRLIAKLESSLISKEINYNIIHRFRYNFTYCPICLNEKYHSTLHQFHFFQTCPFHCIPLLKECPSCNSEIEYIFDDKSFSSSYQCICGHSFSDKKKGSFRNNALTRNIKDKGILEWIQQSDEYKAKLYNINLLQDFHKPPYTESDYKYSHIDLTEVINGKHTIKLKLSTSSSRTLLEKRKKYLIRNHYELYKKIFPNDFREDNIEIIYRDIQKIYSSIARHFRKNLIRNHINCIKHFTRKSSLYATETCPIAMAYVYWKKRYQGFTSLSFVDNGGKYPLNRLRLMDIGIPIIHFNRFIWSIYKDRLDELSDLYIKYYSWHINRIVGEIILADFNNYLHAAINFIEKGIQINYKTLSMYNFMPQIIFNEFKKDDREYPIYKKTNHNINYEMMENCNCPGINEYIGYVSPIHPLDKLR